MFGIGKILGGVLDAVGLGAIAPFVSLAADVFTGNWAGAAMDVMGLVSKFSGSDFLNNVSQQSPLGGFDAASNNKESQKGGGGLLGNILGKGKIGSIINTFSKAFGAFKDLQSGNFSGALGKAFDCFGTVKGFVDDQQLFNERSSTSRTASFAG